MIKKIKNKKLYPKEEDRYDSKNHSHNIRYRVRRQEEHEAELELKEYEQRKDSSESC